MMCMYRDASMTFRLPAKVRAALQEAAEVERRSLSSTAVLILEGALVERGFLRRPTTPGKRKRA